MYGDDDDELVKTKLGVLLEKRRQQTFSRGSDTGRLNQQEANCSRWQIGRKPTSHQSSIQSTFPIAFMPKPTTDTTCYAQAEEILHVYCILGLKTSPEMHVASRIVVHCYPLLSIVVHFYPSLSIVVHCCPLLSIVVHCCPLLSIVVHCYPLLSIGIHCYPSLSFIVIHCGYHRLPLDDAVIGIF